MSNRIAILGDGSWATAIVKILTDNNQEVNWHIRVKEDLDYIKAKKRNPNYLRSIELHPDKIQLFNSIEETIEGCDTVVLVIPSAYLESSFEKCPDDLLKDKFLISAVKGMVPKYFISPIEFMKQRFGLEDKSLGVVSGPSHAEEIAWERLTYLTASAEDPEKATYISEIFRANYIRTTTSDDIYGTEYAAIMKNIMAVASGIAHGIGYGDNFQAVLISNAIREIKRFVDEVHPITRDIKNSVYLGDLLVTAYSSFSRNRTFGNMIGKGYSVNAAQMEMNMVAEGYYAVKGIYEMNRSLKVAVYNVLYEKISPRIEMSLLIDALD